MGLSKFSTLVLLISFATRFIYAADVSSKKLDTSSPGSSLAVSVLTSFPSSVDELDFKIFNGHKTKAILEFTNNEAEPIIVSSVKSTFSSLKTSPVNVETPNDYFRNLSSARFNVAIRSGEKQSLPYVFTTDLHPQDLRMGIIATISNKNGSSFQIQAFNQTVTIVDPAASIFDPQILFLYLFFTAITGASLFGAYNIWIKPLLPQIKRGTRSGEFVKKSSKLDKASTSSKSQVSNVSLNGSTDVSTLPGNKGYDESWIPDHHIKKPTVKRVKGGSSKKNS